MIIKTGCMLFIMGLFAPAAWAGNASVHIDPMNAILFWSTLILLFGLLGRYLAKIMGQPGVLGELLMGVVVGNICYHCGVELLVFLRDSSTIFSILQKVLQGFSLHDATYTFISDPEYAQEIIQVLSNTHSTQWLSITVALDTFSRYGVIFLLCMVGLESALADLKKTGRASLRVALIGVIVPIILGLCIL
ncbi:MAG TPA: cation:proton antiporter, partial [Legionellaceae bacterium]|nr:cation:proton antiporter [Legionellaceae bacterium]